MIGIEDFSKVELRTARVLTAEAHPDADRLLVLTVDLGTEQRTVVAGIRAFYTPADLVGRTVIMVANLEPRPLRGVPSQGMICAVKDGDRVRLLGVDGGDAPPGLRVT